MRVYPTESLKHMVRRLPGVCPISLREMWDLPSIPPETIICDWFWKVREHGLKAGMFYTAEAIAAWAHPEFDFMDNEAEFEYINDVIMAYAASIEDIGSLDLVKTLL